MKNFFTLLAISVAVFSTNLVFAASYYDIQTGTGAIFSISANPRASTLAILTIGEPNKGSVTRTYRMSAGDIPSLTYENSIELGSTFNYTRFDSNLDEDILVIEGADEWQLYDLGDQIPENVRKTPPKQVATITANARGQGQLIDSLNHIKINCSKTSGICTVLDTRGDPAPVLATFDNGGISRVSMIVSSRNEATRYYDTAHQWLVFGTDGGYVRFWNYSELLKEIGRSN